MRFEVSGINHERVRRTFLSRQAAEYLVENPHFTSPDEAVVEGFMWPVIGGRVPPAQAILDNEDDPRDDTSIINARNAMRQREERLNPRELIFGQPEQITHGKAPLPNMNHKSGDTGIHKINGS